MDHYFTAYWQAATNSTGELDTPRDVPGIFPGGAVILRMVRELTGHNPPTFAIIMTDYFGGNGSQYACAFNGERRVTRDDACINDALVALGVQRQPNKDEFDTIGLGEHRSSPEYLDRYVDLCDELGV